MERGNIHRQPIMEDLFKAINFVLDLKGDEFKEGSKSQFDLAHLTANSVMDVLVKKGLVNRS